MKCHWYKKFGGRSIARTQRSRSIVGLTATTARIGTPARSGIVASSPAMRNARFPPREYPTIPKSVNPSHLANLPRWGASILHYDGYDLVRDAGSRPVEKTQLGDVLSTFDEHVNDARTALTSATDGELMAPWAFKRDGVVLMSLPRIQAFKRFTINHVIHHRGQLTVYLRLQNVPLPPIYGPTADEGA